MQLKGQCPPPASLLGAAAPCPPCSYSTVLLWLLNNHVASKLGSTESTGYQQSYPNHVQTQTFNVSIFLDIYMAALYGVTMGLLN